jgi:hypothetical protein
VVLEFLELQPRAHPNAVAVDRPQSSCKPTLPESRFDPEAGGDVGGTIRGAHESRHVGDHVYRTVGESHAVSANPAPSSSKSSSAVSAAAHGRRAGSDLSDPVCVKIGAETDIKRHVVSGSQGDNMERMARMRRGGGRYAVRRFDSRGVRRERSVALRDAVRNGWDAAAVQAALLGDQPTLW